MAILITGGAGYIGSHMVYELADRGEQPVVIDDFSSGFEWAIPADVPVFVGDLGDQQRVAPLIAKYGISEVIHFAGSVVVPESVAEPLRYYRNNTANSRSLFEIAIRSGVRRFILSSTAAVYGDPPANPVTEETPVAPLSPYGSSKFMAETMLRDAARAHGLRYVIVRYFNVAGADPALRAGQATRGATHLIKVAAETAVGLRSKMQVFGTDYSTPDGTCIRDYIHVSDLVRAHLDALAYLRAGGASVTLNCGYGRGFSVLEVIDTVRHVSGVDFKVELAGRRLGSPAPDRPGSAAVAALCAGIRADGNCRGEHHTRGLSRRPCDQCRLRRQESSRHHRTRLRDCRDLHDQGDGDLWRGPAAR